MNLINAKHFWLITFKNRYKKFRNIKFARNLKKKLKQPQDFHESIRKYTCI